MSGWIGVDLDGTLAEYAGFMGATIIGAPVKLMVERVKDWLAQGVEVRIFTARVYAHEADYERQRESAEARLAIEQWCEKHIGQVLPVTCTKDYGMVELWDDRAVRVLHNVGLRCCGDR